MKPYEDCIRACQECFLACQVCLAEMAGKESNNDCPLCCALCVDACITAVKFMSAKSVFAPGYCKLCMDVCAWCAENCMEHDHQHCKDCAEACRRCIEQCRKVVLDAEMV
jgi:hypothetical protein